MPTDILGLTPAAGPSKKTSAATKLLQAAAFAAVLVPLGTVALEADTIQLFTGASATGCYGAGCSGAGVSNTWEFYTNSSGQFGALLYSFRISTPQPLLGTYYLNVGDYVDLLFDAGGANGAFPGLTCVPNFDGDNHCGLFNVSDFSQSPALWPYDVAITWTVKQPTITQWVAILKGDNVPGSPDPFNFTTYLSDSWYNPDPGIGGKGNGFSAFGAFIGDQTSFERLGIPAARLVPEPASLILLGTGLAGVIHRARRRKRQP